jgi:phosphoribosylanthranilate isomerase
MGNVKVKICGITSLADAVNATETGADALGFMFYAPSPRNIEPAKVQEIIKDLPAFIKKVGVFVDAEIPFIQKIVEQTGIDTVQLHGNESPSFCDQLSGLTVYKAFRVQDEDSLKQLKTYSVNAWLLDSFTPGVFGGSGATFNWDIALEAIKLGTPVILAGGLTPENVAEAIRKVRPYGVDVSSGVEISRGKKDPEKVRNFVRNAKSHGSRANRPHCCRTFADNPLVDPIAFDQQAPP